MFAVLIITRHKALSSTMHVSVKIRRERKQSYKFHQGIHPKIFKMLKGEIFSCAASYGCESGLSRRLALVSLDQFSPSFARLFLLSIKRTEQVATLTCMIFKCVQLQGSVKGFPPCDHEQLLFFDPIPTINFYLVLLLHDLLGNMQCVLTGCFLFFFISIFG